MMSALFNVPTRGDETRTETESKLDITRGATVKAKVSVKIGEHRSRVKTVDAEDTLSLSLERFCFVDPEENDTVSCIDQASQLFTGFTKKPPTLEEALASMGYEKAKELAELLTEKATEKLKEFDAPGLTVEDITAIFCYTFEWDKRKFGDGNNPYRALNNSLSVDRNNAALKKTRGILFLLLQALRKLPRFVPESHTLYRGLKIHVQTEADPEFPERKPYATGNEKTWWAFTSTTTSLEATKTFVGAYKATLFVVSGNPWGYDISLFSGFPEEKEILLEPERKLKVTSVVREGQLITVHSEMLSTPLVLEKVVKVPKRVKEIKAKKVIIKEVPENLKAENITDKTIDLSWTLVEVKGKEVKYQVVMKKVGRLFNRSTETVYDGTKSKCTVDNLEQWTEYEFQVRCGYEGDWGKWSEKVIVETNAVNNFVARAESWDTISLSWNLVTTKPGKIVDYFVEMKKEGENMFTEIYNGQEPNVTKRGLISGTEYSFRVCAVCGNEISEWCDAKEKTHKWEECTWKKCPDNVYDDRKYSVDKKNQKVAINTGGHCTIIGSNLIPQNKETSWSIKILKSYDNNGHGIYIGVVPFDIDQNNNKNYECGWYLHCFYTELYSGPPHNYRHKKYDLTKEKGQYVHTGDSVGVVMDTTKGELTFVLNGVNFGIAYDGIPLDKPLVPCVLLNHLGDFVELSFKLL